MQQKLSREFCIEHFITRVKKGGIKDCTWSLERDAILSASISEKNYCLKLRKTALFRNNPRWNITVKRPPLAQRTKSFRTVKKNLNWTISFSKKKKTTSSINIHERPISLPRKYPSLSLSTQTNPSSTYYTRGCNILKVSFYQNINAQEGIQYHMQTNEQNTR